MSERTPDQEIADWIEAVRRFIEGNYSSETTHSS